MADDKTTKTPEQPVTDSGPGKEMNSFSDYKEGSATAEYRAMVDKAVAIAEQQKSRVDPMYHEKIDHLLDTYARKLAENMNQDAPLWFAHPIRKHQFKLLADTFLCLRAFVSQRKGVLA